jgi:hypothetical protein
LEEELPDWRSYQVEEGATKQGAAPSQSTAMNNIGTGTT